MREETETYCKRISAEEIFDVLSSFLECEHQAKLFLDILVREGLIKNVEVIPGTTSRLLLEAIIPDIIVNSAEAIKERIVREGEPLEPEISIRSKIEGGCLWIEVVDNGTGFTGEQLQMLGSRRIESSKDNVLGGAGVHLFNTKSIISPLGWTLKLSNRIDTKGAIVSIGIPL